MPGGSRRLLKDVHGYVKPGTLTALMGASGAGKTTCLDVLAQRKNIGIVSGDLLIGMIVDSFLVLPLILSRRSAIGRRFRSRNRLRYYYYFHSKRLGRLSSFVYSRTNGRA